MTLLASRFVEDMTAMLRSIRRSVEMQADCGFSHAWVLDPVQAQAIAHVRYLVWLVRCAASDLKSRWVGCAAECELADVTCGVSWVLVLTWKSMCDRCLDIERLEMSGCLMRCRRAGMARRRAFR